MNTMQDGKLKELGNLEQQALNALAAHPDPAVRNAVVTIHNYNKRRISILGLVKDALQQLRLDMKYLMYDLECTRRERDEAIAKLDK